MSTAALAFDRMTFDEFLAFEAEAEGKHEFTGGCIYAMGGASDRHNIVSVNFLAAFHAHLRGGPCRPYGSDMALHVHTKDDDKLYYPDVAVYCDPTDTNRLFRERPVLLVEVASPSTERMDRSEKFDAYREIGTLEEYAVVQCETPRIELYRRADDWQRTVTRIRDDARFDSIDLTIPMRTLYEGVDYLNQTSRSQP